MKKKHRRRARLVKLTLRILLLAAQIAVAAVHFGAMTM
jgi:hypothetical protein